MPEKLIRIVATTGRWAGVAATLTILVIVAYSVVMRYVFGTPITWTDELASYLLVVVVMAGAADVMARREHIGVDLLTNALSGRARLLVEVWGLVAVLLVAGTLIYSGYLVATFADMVGLLSDGYLEVPMWIPLATIPVGMGLLSVVALLRLIGLLPRLFAAPPAPEI
ncbi:MAG: TRAP transporter small permease [Alphaproteobacteria bacterium]